MEERLTACFSMIVSGSSARKASTAAGLGGKNRLWEMLAGDEALQVRYRAAVAGRAERYAEDIARIADHPPLMVVTKHGEHVDAGFVAWQRNRIDVRKWTAERLLPKRYGDRLDVSVTGGLALNVHTGQRPREVFDAVDDEPGQPDAMPALGVDTARA
jgi:hypothetical protein